MLPDSVNGRFVTTSPAPSVISRTTILILSGVLMGVGLGQPAVSQVHRQALSASLVGLVSYLGITVAARKRHREAIQTAFEQATWNLNTRLDRFVAGRMDAMAAPHHCGIPSAAPSRSFADSIRGL